MAIRPSQYSPSSPISILPLDSKDYLVVARLEAEVFSDDPISVYAFGPLCASPAVIEQRAESLAKPAVGCIVRMRKAVTKEGKIVGFAFWKFLEDGYGDPSGDDNETLQDEKVESTDGTNGDESAEDLEQPQSRWPEGADVEFCEAVFGKSDELREAVFNNTRYAALNVVIVHPEYQRQGIGSMLVKDGLDEADKQGLRVWLGATQEGLPLYKKFGFEVDTVLEFDMKRFGLDSLEKHTIMIRPAKTTEIVVN